MGIPPTQMAPTQMGVVGLARVERARRRHCAAEVTRATHRAVAPFLNLGHASRHDAGSAGWAPCWSQALVGGGCWPQMRRLLLKEQQVSGVKRPGVHTGSATHVRHCCCCCCVAVCVALAHCVGVNVPLCCSWWRIALATAAVVASQTHHTVQEEESRGRTNHVVSIAGCQGAKKLRRESLSVQEKRLRVSGATQGRGARDDAPQ